MSWFRTARVVFIIACIVAAAVVLVSLITAKPAQQAQQEAVATPPPPSAAATSAHSSLALSDLTSRVTQFETIYRSYDWSNPTDRQQKLANYCLPEMLASIIQTEQQPVREVMRTKQTSQTVRAVTSVSGEVSDDLAEVIVAVNIRKTQTGAEPFEYTLESKTSWVLYKGEWRVYAVDPL